ncbi:phosphoribosylglycinamide formyltransferase [Coraliomargarita sinensis]|uniref:Phosphoribosylglycinamide formyltransferase n=1 Tax=Coraliomargarita sinensis TaxID=2174842 RepID=A0A317ZQ19_9BACT|nr:phosphoribosylglycinamide formyltransferase [Coraliomargarita sinensis]PXA05511.1 phosphoribosylglycinamide formyltransferase [Coraliomargarita sinensis]
MAYPIVILGSGRGSNAEALLKAEASKKLGAAKIAAVISDVEDARILSLGQKFKVPAIYLDPGKSGPRLSQDAEDAYIERIESFSPKLIVLAGFMRILRAKFIEAFEGRVINLHPSLLPSFKGSDGIRDAHDFGVKITGCTVHWVTPALDAGPIIDQKEVRVEDADTVDLLAKKIHIAEHRLLPDVVARLSKGKIKPPKG